MSKPRSISVGPGQIIAGLWLLVLVLSAAATGFLPNELLAPDLLHSNAPPLTSGHLLGTDTSGQDVLTALLYGARTTLLVSLPAATLSAMVGTLLGSLAGYWGNNKLRLPTAYGLAGALGVLCFMLLRPPGPLSTNAEWVVIPVLATVLLGWLLRKLRLLKGHLAVPVDGLVLALVALLAAVPRLLLILVVAAASEPTLPSLVLLLAATFWPSVARLVRAEVLRVRQLPFIDAVRAAGLPTGRILRRHVLPNVLGPIATAWPLSVATIITLETTLSFLGVGLPPEVPSWGRLLAASRLATSSWWLFVLPGLCLLATTLSLRALLPRRA